MTTAPTRILYIAGSGRSCTTLLGHILGQVKGFAFIGEAMYGGYSLATRRCGCGAALAACPFWQAVRDEAGDGHRLEAPEFFGLGRLARWRHLPLSLLPDAPRRLEARYGEHWNRCRRLYTTAAALSAAEVLVDSSKSLPYGRALSLIPGLDVRVVHVVRDPRAVAHSWNRFKPAPDRIDAAFMGRRARGKAAAFWMASNLGAELFFRRRRDGYLRVRYEDLVEHPRESIDRILGLATDRAVAAPFADARTVMLRASHSIAGNPDRLQTGLVEVRADDGWKTAMRAADRRLVTALTWPFLVRYRYLTPAQ